MKNYDISADKKYWKSYYNTHLKADKESLFASFCKQNYFKEKQSLIELGCGNGRDSLYFAKHHLKVLGIDQCENIISFLNQNSINEARFKADDFTSLKKLPCDIVYSRFTLHSITYEQQNRVIEWAKNSLNEKGLFCIETRGFLNSLYKKGEEAGPYSYIYENHFRRFQSLESLLNDLQDFHILYAAEEQNFAPTQTENDFFIRIVAEKI